MELRQSLDILRRRWWIVVAVPLLIALIAGALALARPARYGVGMRLLVTRDTASASTAGRTADGEDTTAQDLPAILQSAALRHDLAQALAQQGQPIDPAALAGSISATTSEHTVAVMITQAQPERAISIARALITVLQAYGLRYWGDPSATTDRPGLHIGVLDPPEQATRLNGPRSIALEVGLRAAAGLGAAIGLAWMLDALARRRTRIAS